MNDTLDPRPGSAPSRPAAPPAREGSYQVESFGGSVGSEIRRLDAQVDLFWSLEQAILDRVGLRDGMDVLDCGCGPGRLIELLRQGKPGLRCVGLEIDPVLVDAARTRFEKPELAGCRVVQGSANSPGLPEESFDFVILRLVIEHIPDPVPALRQMAALLRPGGRLVLISNDFEFHLRTWPAVPELDRLYEAYCASRRKDGGDPCIGRRLPALLREAGLEVAAFETETAHSGLVGDRAFLQAEGAGIPAQLVQSGFLEPEVFQSMVVSWRKMLQHPDHAIMRPLFVGVGEKGDSSSQRSTPAVEAAAEPESTKQPPQPSRRDLDFLAPSSDLEKQLAEIWREAMELDAVGVNSNFFDLGGTSLMLGEIQEEIYKRLDADLSMALLFQYPTIQSLANHLASQVGGDSPTSAAPEQKTDHVAEQAQRRRQAASRRKR